MSALTCPFSGPFVSHAGLTEETIAMQNAMTPAAVEMAQAKAALKAEGKPTSVAGMVKTMKTKYPGYALGKAYQDAKAAGNTDLAAALAVELKEKYLSCEAAAKAALEAEAAWEAKAKAGGAKATIKDVLAKFAAANDESETGPGQAG